MVWKILDFHSSVDEVPVLVGCKAVSDGVWFPRFRYNTVISKTRWRNIQWRSVLGLKKGHIKRLTNSSPTKRVSKLIEQSGGAILRTAVTPHQIHTHSAPNSTNTPPTLSLKY